MILNIEFNYIIRNRPTIIKNTLSMNKLIFLLLCSQLNSFAQGDLQIILKTREGYGPFIPRHFDLQPLWNQPREKNIPKEVVEYKIRQIDFQPYNSLFSAALGAKKQEFIANYNKFNPALLT